MWTELSKRFGGDEHKVRAVWKMKNSYKTIAADRAAKRIKFLAPGDVPTKTQATLKTKAQSSGMTCQATTLSGRPCKFKATCGNFCKKHKV